MDLKDLVEKSKLYQAKATRLNKVIYERNPKQLDAWLDDLSETLGFYASGGNEPGPAQNMLAQLKGDTHGEPTGPRDTQA